VGSGRAEETPQRVGNMRECEAGEEQGKEEDNNEMFGQSK